MKSCKYGTALTHDILSKLREGPVLQSDFPKIKFLYDKVHALRKLLPAGYTIEGKLVWTKGKFGIQHQEWQYTLKTTQPQQSLSASSCAT